MSKTFHDLWQMRRHIMKRELGAESMEPGRFGLLVAQVLDMSIDAIMGQQAQLHDQLARRITRLENDIEDHRKRIAYLEDTRYRG